ncbi:MAG: type VI secretion system tube protein Hcp [Cyanobacteria bacterium P01_F01_bin.86]
MATANWSAPEDNLGTIHDPLIGPVLTIAGNEFASDIPLLSYGWDVTQSSFNPNPFSFAALQTADSPFLTQAVASGTLIDQLTLVDYRDIDGDGKGEAVAQFTLEDVVFTHYGQSSGENNLPIDTFQVSFGQMEVDYDVVDPSPQAEHILSFGKLGDIQVNAFTAPSFKVGAGSHRGSGAGTGWLTVDELVIETTLNAASPDLIAALTSGTLLSDVVLSEYIAVSGQSELLSQWELRQAVVTSYAIASDETTDAVPSVRFTLAPQIELTQTVNFDSDANGSLDSSNQVSVKLDDLEVGVREPGLRTQTLPVKPVNGTVLAITEAKQLSEIQLLSYGWEITRPEQANFDAGEFSFAALQTANSSFLTQAVASGTLIDQLTLVDYRDVDGDGTGEAVAQFTLEDVVFTHYGQSSGENALPIDTFQVSFGQLEVDYDRFDPKTGNFIRTNSSTLDVVNRTSSTPEDFGGMDLADLSPQAEHILSFGKLGDIQVNAFTAPSFKVGTGSHRGSGAGTGLVTVDELVIETALNAASPDLIAALTSGTLLSDVVLSEYVAMSGQPELLSQWELRQAAVTSYAISSDETTDSVPSVRFTLAPQIDLTQTVNFDSDKNGSLDSSNQVSVKLDDLEVGVREPGLSGQVLPTEPVNGTVLAIAEAKQISEIQLLSYEWEITRPAQANFDAGEFSFAALQTVDSPFLTQAVVSGTLIDQLTLVDYRDVDGDGTGEAVAQFTLEDVVFTHYDQSSGENDIPVDTFQVSFGQLEVDYDQFDPQTGNLIRTNSSTLDVVSSTSSTPEDFGGTDLVEPSPQAGHILSFGELGDIRVNAFTAPTLGVDLSSGPGGGAQTGRPSVDELVIETALNEATPDLIAALTSGTVLTDVVLSEYAASAGKPELLSQWELTQAVVTSYAIAQDETAQSAPIVRFSLAPQAKLAQTVNFDSDQDGSLDSRNRVLLDVANGTVIASSIDSDSSQLASLTQDTLTGTSGDSVQVGEEEDLTATNAKAQTEFGPPKVATSGLYGQVLDAFDDGPMFDQPVLNGLTLNNASRFQGSRNPSVETFAFGNEPTGAIATGADVSIAAFNHSIPFG